MTEPLTLDQAKDLVAQKYGRKNWKEINMYEETCDVYDFFNEAHEMCLSSQKQHAFNQGCEAQKDLCIGQIINGYHIRDTPLAKYEEV